MKIKTLLAAALAGGLCACSLVLKWDLEGLPCDPNVSPLSELACLSGYTCLVDKCVANQSIGLGETCLQNDQCRGYTAVNTPIACVDFVCRNLCTVPWTQNTCAATELCTVFHEVNFLSSACAERVLCTNNACEDTANTCVQIATGVQACLKGCAISWEGGYQTSCAVNESCQVVGQANVESLVCVPTIDAGFLATDSPCNSGSVCRNKNGCVDNVCRQFCDTSAPVCSAGQTCFAANFGTEFSTGYCR